MTAHVPVPSIWTDQHVERLKQLNADGLSRSQIAGQLGEGFTRNSVIGKLHRLGIDGPPKPSKPRYKPASRAPRKKRHLFGGPVIKIVKTEPDPTLEEFNRDIPLWQRVGLLELTKNVCHFPCGEPGEPGFFFCGGEISVGSYCAFHHRAAHQKPQPRGLRADR